MNNEILMKRKAELPPITESFFDVKRIFSSKNEKLARLLPGFFFSYLIRVIHQEGLNKFMWENRDKEGLEFVAAILKEFGVHPQVFGIERVPASGKWLIASNHPLGGMDGLALLDAVGRVRKDVVFPVNDLLMNIPNLFELFIPINKHGSNAENIQIINDTFASDTAILYFPAGLVSRKQNGVIRDLQWKKTFLTKAKKYQRDIIPVFITGRNSNFFYNLANIRKKIGLKANIEMLYLVNEMVNLKEKDFHIYIGHPIPWQTFDRRYSDQEWSDLVKNHVYSMKDNPDILFPYLKENN